MTNYITTKPVEAALVARIEGLIPRHCRSVTCLHGDTDADPVRYQAHRAEIEHVRRAIRVARREVAATYTYAHNYAARLGDEIVTVPDQIANTDAWVESLPADAPLTQDTAQKHHDRAGTTFPARRRDGSEVIVRLDGDAYGLWTPGTGDMIVRRV